MSTDPMQKFGKDNMDMAMATFGAWTKNAQAIATEFADYSKKSFEDSAAALEKLMGAKSLETAVAVQTEYLKSSYEDFVAESAKIGELYADLAKEAYKPFEGVLAKTLDDEVMPGGRGTAPARLDPFGLRPISGLSLKFRRWRRAQRVTSGLRNAARSGAAALSRGHCDNATDCCNWHQSCKRGSHGYDQGCAERRARAGGSRFRHALRRSGKRGFPYL